MSIKIFEQLKSVQDLRHSMDSYDSVKKIFEDFLLKVDSPFKNQDKYFVKTSVGTGSVARMWWCGIFDIDLYKDFFGAKTKVHLGAGKGYYIAYLFNDDKKRVYLTISQASKGIKEKKNQETLNYIRQANRFLHEYLSKDRIYLRDIYSLLSIEYDQGREYEEGTILAIEYDLTGEPITDEKFYSDLKKMKEEFKKFKKLIYDNKGIIQDKHNNIKYDLIDRSISENKTILFDYDDEAEYINKTFLAKPISKEDAEEISAREPEFIKSGMTKKLKTDEKLRKFVLDNYGRICQCDNDHITFLVNDIDYYMEVHHLVPLKYQTMFEKFNLDRLENLSILCPNCHKSIHYGNLETKKKALFKLYNESAMKEILLDKNICFNFEDFIRIFYK